jgi:hypothetical protein
MSAVMSKVLVPFYMKFKLSKKPPLNFCTMHTRPETGIQPSESKTSLGLLKYEHLCPQPPTNKYSVKKIEEQRKADM